MFHILKGALEDNPLTNKPTTDKSTEAAEMKSTAYILHSHESLKSLSFKLEPEQGDVLDELEITMTKLEGKYKGFEMLHLPHNL